MAPNKTPNPTPEEIIALAESMGYAQRRSEVSRTLFFITEGDDEDSEQAVKINVYYTTRSIMTHLNHPSSAGLNELWRSNAYDNIDELREFFENPRLHTGKGYRNAHKAVRGCVECGEMKKRDQFSKNQWAKGPDGNKCLNCTSSGKTVKRGSDADLDDITRDLQGVSLGDEDGGDDFPPLTADVLNAHNKKVNKKKPIRQDMERRQFNCPVCPKEGRGNNIFYKKVPKFKPVVKCSRCKKVSRGKCQRLYPVPKEDERGYGLFQCHKCGDKWGSSRAINNIGQNCFTCAKKGEESIVVPFRMEVYRKRKGNTRMVRVPKEPIKEDEEVEPGYGEADRMRNEDSARNALVMRSATGRRNGFRGRNQQNMGYESDPGDSHDEVSTLSSYGPEQSYDFVPKQEPAAKTTPSVPVGKTRIPQGYQHKCAGCKKGLCKSRKIPKSEIHDTSDGNTVSTRSSIVSNSSVDKSEFIDRDEDFSGFDIEADENDENSWIAV